MIISILILILSLGILIFVHELGHFISAKATGIKVEEFGFGYPPRIFGIKIKDTLYSLNLLPFGGFVKIYGETKSDKSIKIKDKEKTFWAKPAWQRAIVLTMGVVMNIILAGILLSLVFKIGAPTIVTKELEERSLAQNWAIKNIEIKILEISPNSPAEQAGLMVGDAILSAKYKDEIQEIKKEENLQKFITRHAGESIVLTVKRNGEILEKQVVPRISPPQNQGPIGIFLAKVGTVSYPWYTAIWQGFKRAGQLLVEFVVLFFQLIKNLILKGASMGRITGPVGIAVLTFQMTKLGLAYVLQFIAIISLNLAILNILPFPALDGGRLLFLAIEKIKGSPISPKTENLVNSIGFAVLIFLMILVTIKDIAHFF